MQRKNSRDNTQPRRSPLQILLESTHRGYAYEMLELQMALEDNLPMTGSNKINEITKLIQLYMMGVEALEGAEDQRFKFFSRKLQTLMLKKPVADQLKSASTSPPISNPLNKLQKRQQHEIQLMYSQDMNEKQRVRQLVQNVDDKLKSYEGIVTRQIKRQQDQIKQRIKLRKLKSDSGSVQKYEQAPNQYRKRQTNPFEFFDETLIDKKIEAVRQKNLVTTMRHDGI